MQLLKGRVVLVTGAGQGIGRGIAEAVAEAGGQVVATDLNLEAAATTASSVIDGGGRALGLELDVTDEDAFRRAAGRTVSELGRLDGLVNNAGVLSMAPAFNLELADWRHQTEVNLLGVATGCRVVAEQMRALGGGAIVNIASNAGKVGYPNMAAYNATKAAVINLTRSLAAEWSEFRINVNAVCPGGVSTPMLEDVADWVGERIDRDPEELLATMVPAQLGRHIQPIEVGRVVAFLLSDRAAIIRGQAINVDGGDTPY
jgi:meso-butanediol dehydrogenase/(S,S)-butanediol dehydrogenase/diacetyl reductase